MLGLALPLRNTRLDDVTARAGNAALLRVYTAPRPATGGAATTLLVEWTLGTPFAAAAVAAVLSPTLPADTTGVTNGTASWWRIVKSDGTTHVMDGDVGVEMTMNTTSVATGAACKVLSFSISEGNP